MSQKDTSKREGARYDLSDCYEVGVGSTCKAPGLRGLHLMKTTAFPNSELEILQVSCLWFMPQSLFHCFSSYCFILLHDSKYDSIWVLIGIAGIARICQVVICKGSLLLQYNLLAESQ